jgi:hypothetical protein
MDSRAMKLSELPQIAPNNITEADLIYLVQKWRELCGQCGRTGRIIS